MGSYDLAHHAPSVETKLAQRGWLMRLWSEISVLPRAQRLSLLLNLRDERGEAALSLLPVAGVATLQQIASVLDMPVRTVKSHLQRSIAMLREKIDRTMGDVR